MYHTLGPNKKGYEKGGEKMWTKHKANILVKKNYKNFQGKEMNSYSCKKQKTHQVGSSYLYNT